MTTATDFEKTMLQQISDVAWIVHQQGNRLGILNKDVQEHFTYINGSDYIEFRGETEVIKHFGNASLFDTQITSPTHVQDTYYVKGYSVDYVEPFAIDEDDPRYRSDLPLYTKIKDSDVLYCAGYYCISFDKGWKHAHGPKLATLLKYGFEGPFKTELEMKQRLKYLNKNNS